MRRGINIRKKNRIALNQFNKKTLKLLFLSILILIVCISIYFFFFKVSLVKKNFESDTLKFSTLNENIPFTLNKIILFSSATAETENVNHSFVSLDISQYCDIGIYLNNIDIKNTFIKSLYIDDISISSPELGTPCLYKKRITDLGKCSFSDEAIIENNYNFNIINHNGSVNFDNYELLSNGNTPISLGFYNRTVKENFITDLEEISYNGTLLKEALIPQTSLNSSISFKINIVTNTDEEYICNVSFDIPFEDLDGSLYDKGYAIKELKNSETNKFIRVK